VYSNVYWSCVCGSVSIVGAGVIKYLWELCFWFVATGGADVFNFLLELCLCVCGYWWGLEWQQVKGDDPHEITYVGPPVCCWAWG